MRINYSFSPETLWNPSTHRPIKSGTDQKQLHRNGPQSETCPGPARVRDQKCWKLITRGSSRNGRVCSSDTSNFFISFILAGFYFYFRIFCCTSFRLVLFLFAAFLMTPFTYNAYESEDQFKMRPRENKWVKIKANVWNVWVVAVPSKLARRLQHRPIWIPSKFWDARGILKVQLIW